MPLTFPSHAAAVLPLHAVFKRLPLSALIVGSAAPDFAYSVGWDKDLAHTWLGPLLFCAPAGLGVYAALVGIILPALHQTLPRFAGVEWGRFAATGGLPRGLRAWAAVLLAVVVGAYTHVLWDGFTHALRWPASALYGEAWASPFGLHVQVANLLQHLSTLLGAGVVGAYAARRYPALPSTGAGSGRWAALLALALGAGTLLALALDWETVSGGRTWQRQLWLAFFVGIRGAALALLGWSLAALWTRRRRAAPA